MRRKRAGRFPAILPPQLPQASMLQSVDLQQLTNSVTYTASVISGDVTGQSAKDIVFEQTVCRRADFSATHLETSQCVDVVFDSCELAQADWERVHMQRVEYRSARLTGFRLIGARLDHVIFERCQADLALFWAARLRDVRFEQCRLQEASFEGADLTGVVFRNCDLTNADLRNTVLKDADLRGSILSGVQIGIKELQGVIVDPQQTVELAGLLGTIVRSLEDDSALQ